MAISSYTAQNLITQALKVSGVLGVGQSVSNEDGQDALQLLNLLLEEWQPQRWLVYDTTTVSVLSTGAQSYTIGTGMDFNMDRPTRIESAYARFANASPNTIDIPLALINAREDYNEITIKNLTTLPQAVFYDSGYPSGQLYFWPVPPANQYYLFVTATTPLQSFSSLSQTVSMPAPYTSAMVWSLAERLRPTYGLPPDGSISSMAARARNALRLMNAQVPSLNLPGNVPGTGRGYYNPYGDKIN